MRIFLILVFLLLGKLDNVGDVAHAVSRGNCAINSFTSDIVIHTDKGLKAAESIKTGDKLFAEDPKTGESGYFEVVAVYSHPVTEILRITVDDNGTDNLAPEAMEITPGHPVYVEIKGWLKAEDLTLGDRLRRKDGGWVKVLAIEQVIFDTPQKVYNFTVKGIHTYFVLEAGVLVHNCGGGAAEALFKRLDNAENGMISVNRGDVTLDILQQMAHSNAEVVYLRNRDTGGLFLRRLRNDANRASVAIPDGNYRVIAHTHPGRSAWPSLDDAKALGAYRLSDQQIIKPRQFSSVIVAEGGMVVRFRKSRAEHIIGYLGENSRLWEVIIP